MNLIYRIIDVNSNRVREASRVIEDYARFVLNDTELYNAIRSIRHRVLIILSKSSLSQLAFRDIEQDVGRKQEPKGKNLPEVVISNCRRISEALRSISEYLKIKTPSLALKVEQLRFEVYQLEQKLSYILYPKKLFDKVRLYVLVPENINHRPIENIIPDLIRNGVDAVQLRTKNLNDKKLLTLAKKIRKITLLRQVIFIVNDRVDIAMLSQADGVHLGETDLSISDTRKVLGDEKIIGRTTHSLKEALEAQGSSADYISVGPFFASPTKQLLKARGFGYLKNIAKKIHIPYVAIGGITRENLPRLLKVHKKLSDYPLKIAISSGILDSKDILRATKAIKSLLNH
jgi:thiamine-phosphate pyrophosphorylase